MKDIGNDNTQADNAVADVFFFAPSPSGDGEIKLVKISMKFPKTKQVKMKFPLKIETQIQQGKSSSKVKITCCEDDGSEWVWNFGDM